MNKTYTNNVTINTFYVNNMSEISATTLRLPNLDVRQIRVFLVVAEELHFGRAAERLFTSQPALSRTIHKLEMAVRVLLFERSTRRLRLISGQLNE